jgi:geranylgeranyl diphosphate synthase type 3
MSDRPFSPFASPNAIPPRTSSQNIPNAFKYRPSVLRPLSENAWISQSKKSKHSHNSAELVNNPYSPVMSNLNSTNANANNAYSHSYPTPAPMSPQSPDPLKGVGDDLIYRQRSTWTDEKERILLGPFDYLYGHPGKDIRSQLIAAFNKWLRVPPERLEVITRVVGMLHTASLLYAFDLPS